MFTMRTALAHFREELPSYLVMGSLVSLVFIL